MNRVTTNRDVTTANRNLSLVAPSILSNDRGHCPVSQPRDREQPSERRHQTMSWLVTEQTSFSMNWHRICVTVALQLVNKLEE